MNYLQTELNELMDERSTYEQYSSEYNYNNNVNTHISLLFNIETVGNAFEEDLNKKISERQNINSVKTNDHAEIKGYFPNELFPSAFNNREPNVDPEPKSPDPYIKDFHLESDCTKY